MPSKKKQKEPSAAAMNYRVSSVAQRAETAPSTLDEKTRSVEVVMATENPVTVRDWERGIIQEVLLIMLVLVRYILS